MDRQEKARMLVDKEIIKEAILESKKLNKFSNVKLVWNKDDIDYVIGKNTEFLPNTVMVLRPSDRYSINYIYNYMVNHKLSEEIKDIKISETKKENQL